MIDRDVVKNAFASYVKNYNANDPKINLKIIHTYKVSDLCHIIAESLGLSKEEIDLAWTIGMLHDIGRFEQCRIYNTFIDSKSVDHAKFGCELLFGQDKLIERFVVDAKYYDTIHNAIYYHSVYKLPDDMTGSEKLYTQILRDADKIDIIRANNETGLTDIYDTTEELVLNSQVTKEVLDEFYKHHAILRSLKKTPVDNIVGHLSLMFELVYPKSLELARDLGYVDQMLKFQSKNETTNEVFCEIRAEMKKFFDMSCKHS